MKRFRARGALAAAAMLSVLAALAGCGASSGSASSGSAAGMQANPSSSAAEMNPNLDLGSSLGAQPAPDIKLVNQFGQPMSLSHLAVGGLGPGIRAHRQQRLRRGGP